MPGEATIGWLVVGGVRRGPGIAPAVDRRVRCVMRTVERRGTVSAVNRVGRKVGRVRRLRRSSVGRVRTRCRRRAAAGPGCREPGEHQDQAGAPRVHGAYSGR
jgi:hypothetical protein